MGKVRFAGKQTGDAIAFIDGQRYLKQSTVAKQIAQAERNVELRLKAERSYILTEQEAKVLMWRLEGATYTEIGLRLEISSSRAQQLAMKAFRRLRRPAVAWLFSEKLQELLAASMLGSLEKVPR